MDDKTRLVVESAIRDIVSARPELLTPLRRILKYEESCDGCPWTILDVIIKPRFLKELLDSGIVVKVDDLNYKLIDYKVVKQVMEDLRLIGKPGKSGFNVTMKMFEDIVGYEQVKKLIFMALRARAPVHVLLVGPPGIGKSIFLDTIRKYLEENKECVGYAEGGRSLTTGVGLVELLLQLPSDTPCVLIIDELDKMDHKNLDVLHRLMVTGEIIIVKHNKIIREKRNIWVLAAANKMEKLPAQILSRFHIVKFKPLTQDEYVAIIPRILVNREGIEPELAEYIAEKLAPHTRDPRDAIKVARMAYTKEDVDWLIENTIKRSVRV